MPVETGNLSRLVYCPEAIFGVAPSTPTGIILRQNGFTLDADRNIIDNTELRTDSMYAAGRGGALRGKGSISGLLSYGTYDAFIAAVCGLYDWNSNVAKIKSVSVCSATTLAVAATGKTFTRPSGSFIVDGFAVGDYITTSGFTSGGNNSTFLISGVTATVITCSTATGLVDEAANPNGKLVLSNRPSFVFERQHLVNGMYFPFLGGVVNDLELSGKVNAAVEIKIGLLTKSVSTEANTSLFSTLTQPNTNPLITSWEGSIKKDTVSLANVVGWDVKLVRNLDPAEVVGSSALYDIQPKATKVTGSLELYFDSMSLYTAMRQETDVALQLNLGPGGNLSYSLDLTKTRIKTWKSTPKDGLCTATVEFESYAPNSGQNTSAMFTRLP